MAVDEQSAGGRFVLAPRDALVAGGAAEELESTTQRLFRRGHRRLVVDLGGVDRIDSAGIRALVRAHTTAERLGGSLRLARPGPRVMEVLSAARLDGVLSIHDSVELASRKPFPWRDTVLTVAGLGACVTVAALGTWRPLRLVGSGEAALAGGGSILGGWPQPLATIVKLLTALVIGVLVTAVMRRQRPERPSNRSMDEAQVLLCLAGALMMIIISDNLARAFGIAGAASIIRFRTPVEDPKDVTVIFLLMALGMACGMGALDVAAAGAIFLCGVLVALDLVVVARHRFMLVEMTASGRTFPEAHVAGVLSHSGIGWEPREFSTGDRSVMTYTVTLPPSASIEEVSALLVGDGTHGLASIAWQPPKRLL